MCHITIYLQIRIICSFLFVCLGFFYVTQYIIPFYSLSLYLRECCTLVILNERAAECGPTVELLHMLNAMTRFLL